MTIVRHRHCRELGYCNRGLRQWCAREGIDWPDFLKNGISVDILKASQNAMAERAIALAERECDGQQ